MRPAGASMAAACDATPSGAPGAESPWTAAWGHEYWASAAVQEWGRALAELVLQGAPHVAQGPEGTLLDYGCGPGVFLLSMAKNEGARSLRLVGLDPSPAMIEVLDQKAAEMGVEKGARVQWGHLSGTLEAEAEAEAFDIVVVSLVLSHAEASQRETILSDIHRAMRPGGTLFVAEFGVQDPSPPWAAFRKRGFTAAHAESLLSSQGFQGVRVAGTHSLAAHGHNTPVVVITASKL